MRILSIRHALTAFSLRVIHLLVCGALLFGQQARTWASDTEDDVVTNATALDSAASYSNGHLPANNADLTFSSSTYVSTTFTLNTSNLITGTLDDLDATQALTINGSKQLTLAGGIDTVAGSMAGDLLHLAIGTNLTINLSGGLVLGTSGNFDLAGTAQATINAAISGGYVINKTGAGTLTLTGANTYSGGTTLVAGVISLGSAGALGSTGTLSFSGGTLQYGSANTTDYSGRFSTAVNQSYNIDTNGQSVTFATALTSSGGSLTKLGTGTLTLTGANTYAGTTTVSAGTLAVGTGGSIGGGNVTVDTGGTLTQSGTSILSVHSEYVGDNGTGTFTQSGGTNTVITGGQLQMGINGNSSGTYNLSGGQLTAETDVGDAGTAVFNLSGGTHTTGSLDLGYYGSGNGTYNLGGTGVLQANDVAGYVGTSSFYFNGGTLQARQSNTSFFQNLTGAYVGAGGANIDSNGFNVTVAQALQPDPALGTYPLDGGLTKLGAGTLTLTGNNTYTGNTTVRAGTLAIAAGSMDVADGGNTFTVSSNNTLSPPAATLSGTASLSTGEADIGHSTGETGAFTQSGGSFTTNGFNLDIGSEGTGTYTLSGTGSTLSTGETLIGGFGTGNGGGGTFTQSGGTFTTNGNFLTVGYNGGTGTYMLSGTGSLSTGDVAIGIYSGTGTFTQTGGSFTTNGHNLRIGYSDATGTYMLSGTGSLSTGEVDLGTDGGTGTFTQTGGGFTTNGSAVILGTHESSGTYQLDGGTLTTGSVGSQGGTGTFHFNGGTLQAAASSTSFFGGLTTADVQAGGALIDTQGFNVTVAQNLSSGTASSTPDGGLTKLGPGTLILTGANTFTGPTIISAGTLQLGSTDALEGSTLVTSPTAGALVFSSGINNFTLGGLNGNGDLVLTDTAGARATIVVGANNTDTTYSGALSGVGGLTKVGTGTLTLTGNSAYQDTTRIDGGTLVLANGAGLSSSYAYIGDSASGSMVQTGGSFTTNGNNLVLGQSAGVNGTYTLSAGKLSTGEADLGNSGTGTFTQTGGSFTTNGNLLVVGNGGTGTFTQSGGSLSTGKADISTGTFTQTGGSFTTNGNLLTVGNEGTGTFTLSGTGSSLSTGETDIGLSIDLSNSTGTFIQEGGSFTTNGNPLKVGNGGAGVGNGGTGTFMQTGGSLSTGEADIGLYAGTGTFTQTGGSFTTNGQFLVIGLDESTGAFTLSGTGSSLSTGQVDLGYLYGTGTFTQTGGSFTTNGKAVILGIEYGSGTYQLDGGLLTTGSVGSQQGTGTFNFNGGTLQAAASSTSFFQGIVTANVQTGGAFIDTQNFNVTMAQDLLHDTTSGAPAIDGGLTKLGPGTLTLTGANTYTGPTTINDGTLQVGAGSTAGALGSGAVVDDASLVFDRSDALSEAAGISGSGSVTKLGVGTLTLGGTNSFMGGLTVRAGTVSVASDAALGDVSSEVTLVNGGRLAITGTSFVTARTFNLDNAGSTLTPAAGGSITYASGAVVNGGNLGAGSHVLGDGSSFYGTTALASSALSQSGGTVNADTLTVHGSLNQSGGTLNLTNAQTASSSTVTIGGTVNVSGAEFDGVTTINDNGTLNNAAVNGQAATNLTFGGGSRTTINSGGILSTVSDTDVELDGGLLVNNGTQSGILDVNYGSTLKGAGTFGTVNVTSGGKFSPGNSPGTATVSNLSFQAAGSYQFELTSATAANNSPGNNADLINVENRLTISAGTTANGRFTVAIVSLDSNDNPAPLTDFDASKSYRFVLVTTAGITGFNPGEFTVDTSGFSNHLSGGSFSVVQDGNNLDLLFAAVPEPSIWALLSAGGAGLLGLRLRRRGLV